MHIRFWSGKLKERDHLEDLEVNERIILKWILKNWDGRINWINPVQNRDRWRAAVNAVMNLRVPYNSWNFLIS